MTHFVDMAIFSVASTLLIVALWRIGTGMLWAGSALGEFSDVYAESVYGGQDQEVN